MGSSRGITREDGSLESSTVGDSLIEVDQLVGLLAVKEVRNQLDDTRDTGRPSNKNDFMDIILVNIRITEGVEGTAEDILTELFKTSTSDGSVKVDTLV